LQCRQLVRRDHVFVTIALIGQQHRHQRGANGATHLVVDAEQRRGPSDPVRRHRLHARGREWRRDAANTHAHAHQAG
jgi:hypothetical protein